jgi:hypothetical protein
MDNILPWFFRHFVPLLFSSSVVFLCSLTEAIPKDDFPTKCIRESRWSAVFFRGSPREREKIEVASTKQIFGIFRSGFPQPCECSSNFLQFWLLSSQRPFRERSTRRLVDPSSPCSLCLSV